MSLPVDFGCVTVRNMSLGPRRSSSHAGAWLVGLVLLLGASAPLKAAIVNWLPDADGAWENPANWSSNPNLPDSSDDAVIDVGGATVRTINVSSSQTVSSVTSEERLNITSGTFTTGGGTSVVNGPLNVENATLRANVSGGSFTANGTTTVINSGLVADNAAQLSVPNLTNYAFASTNRVFDAFDTGSLLDLSGLTTVDANSGNLIIRPWDGGTVDLSGLTTLNNPNGRSVTVLTLGAGSTADLSALSNFGATGVTSIDVRDTSTVLWNNPTTIDGLTLTIRDSGTIATNQITTLDNSDLTAINSSPTFGSLASADETNFESDDGAQLSLPSLGHYALSGGNRRFDAFDAGSMLDLSALTTITATGGNLLIRPWHGGTVDLSGLATLNNPNSRSITVQALGAGSTADLSALDNFGATGVTSIDVRDTSTVLWNNPTTIDGLTLTIQDSGTIATNQITTLENSILTAMGSSPTFGSLASADNTNLQADDGGQISFPSLTEYTFTAGNRQFDAFDAGSLLDLSALTTINANGGNLLLRAWNGGTLDLSGLTTLDNPNGRSINVQTLGAGSTVDLSSLANFGATGVTSVDVRNTSTVLWNNPTLIDGLTLTIRDSGTIATNQITTLDNSNLTAIGSSPSFGSLASADDTNVESDAGGQLSFPSLTQYTFTGGNRQFDAFDAGSLVDLSALTTINANGGNLLFRAWNGGTLDLSGLTTLNNPSGRSISVQALGAGSTADLSALTDFGATGVTSIEVRDTSTVLWNNPTTIDGLTLTIHESGTIATNQIVTFDNSNVAAIDSSPSFGSLASADNTNFEADNGGQMSFPNLSDYTFTGGNRQFDAFDAGSLLDLSALTTINANGGNLIIRALNGATVDLSGLTTVNNTDGRSISVQASIASSTVDLSSLTDFGSTSVTSVDVQDTSTVLWNNPTTIDGLTLTIRDSGSITTNQITTLDNSDLRAINSSPTFGSLASADNTNFEADDGGQLSFPSLSDYTFTSGSRQFDVFDTGSLLDLSALTTITANSGNLILRTQRGGTIDLSGLTTINNPTGRSITITTSGTDGNTLSIGNLFQPRNTAITLSGEDNLLDVDQSIVLRAGSTLFADGSSIIATGKHHLFETTTENQWDVEEAELRMDGTGVQFLEIGGQDLGAPGPASDNFGIGQLTVGTPGQDTIVRLAEEFDNGNRSSSEALYLYGLDGGDGLSIEGGSTLVIGSYTAVYNVYANISGVMTHLNALFGVNDTVIPFDNGFLALEPPGPRPLLGDMDLDSDVDFDDIDDFVLALQDPIAYFLAFEEVSTSAGDTDGDGDLDFDDIDDFVAILNAPPLSAPRHVPEPSTLVLGILCAAALVASGRPARLGTHVAE